MNLKITAWLLLIVGEANALYQIVSGMLALPKLLAAKTGFSVPFILHGFSLYLYVFSVAFLLVLTLPFIRVDLNRKILLAAAAVLFAMLKTGSIAFIMYYTSRNFFSSRDYFYVADLVVIVLLDLFAFGLFFYDSLGESIGRALVVVPLLMGLKLLFSIGTTSYFYLDTFLLKDGASLPIAMFLSSVITQVLYALWLLFFIAHYKARATQMAEPQRK